MSRIFISYKRADKDLVFPIKNKIETETGEKCWIDLEDIEGDAKSWEDKIINAINESSIFLFMYSKHIAEIKDDENDRTLDEFNFARSKNKRIVFINIDQTPLTDKYAFRFGQRQHVDATSPKAVEQLINDIRKWVKIAIDPVQIQEIKNQEQLENLIAEFLAVKGFVTIDEDDLEDIYNASSISYLILPYEDEGRKYTFEEVLLRLRVSLKNKCLSHAKMYLYIKTAVGGQSVTMEEMQYLHQLSEYLEQRKCDFSWGMVEKGIRNELFVIIAHFDEK